MQYSIHMANEPGSEQDREIDEFLATAWSDYHRALGHDPEVDWSSTSVIFVAYSEDQEVAGVARGRVAAGVGHPSELMVERAHRGRGLGSALLDRFEAHCTRLGCHKLSVHTDEDGTGRDFYLRRGWKLESRFVNDKGHQNVVRLVKFTSIENP